jgi:hypothetical protein
MVRWSCLKTTIMLGIAYPVCDGQSPRTIVTVSYLSDAIDAFDNKRQRAFFVPRPGEQWTQDQYDLRNKRADPERYAEVYRV